ncbi:hypothetical protein L2E82_36381 [Cichorium intybus]|uniref:Uncharacterized protein n=1 Tax=Cichorium intybus TaxID=13427 RepID=A0ACB9BRP2_CICIN|nr:hypothetical protein L2E82_36381 [Cichorium intybus]
MKSMIQKLNPLLPPVKLTCSGQLSLRPKLITSVEAWKGHLESRNEGGHGGRAGGGDGRGRCASIDNTPYSSKFNMSIFNPKESSTSKKVTCNHRICTASCPGIVSTCPYLSSQTSTSGIFMEDFLHLETDDINRQIVNAFVTFRCGQVQSGSFLHVAAPNSLFNYINT